MIDLSQFQARLDNLLNAVEQETGKMAFSRTNDQHVASAMLLVIVIRLAHGIKSCLQVRDDLSAFILLKTLLEAYVDLNNSVDNDRYIDYMNAHLLNDKGSLLKKMKDNPTNIYFSSQIDNNELNEAQQELKSLEGRGVKALNVHDKFKKAGQLDMYQGPYRICCQHAHNIRVMAERHLRSSRNGVEILAFPDPSDDVLCRIADTVAGIAANSVAAVKGLLGGGKATGLEAVERALNELRELFRGTNTPL